MNKKHDLEIAKFLLEGNFVSQESLNRGLLQATKLGKSSIVELLLMKGVEINFTDQHGNTALLAAALQGDLNCIQLLLKYNADINCKNSQGNSVLHEVVAKPGIDPKCISLLIDKVIFFFKHGM